MNKVSQGWHRLRRLSRGTLIPGTYTVSISIPASGETYEPTVWQTGDTITAEKLNKIEQAIYVLSGGIPAGYVTIAPEQSVTVTLDSAVNVPQLQLADGIDLMDYVASAENWIVLCDDTTLNFRDYDWYANYGNIFYSVGIGGSQESPYIEF